MEIILSPNCKSVTGTINSVHGYYIQQRSNRFFSKRKAKGNIPPDGHCRYIRIGECAPAKTFFCEGVRKSMSTGQYGFCGAAFAIKVAYVYKKKK